MRNYFKVAITQRKKPTLFSRIQTALLLFMAGTMVVVFIIFSLFIIINYDSNLFATKQGEWISCNLVLFIVILLIIFFVVMFLGSLLSYIISKRLSAPLSIIEEHMSQIEVGGENAKINYPSIEGDALSKLVSQYNAMIDKLAVSVEELAQAEREESWRQMARQMAHEIKNPLTPMKLLSQRLLLLEPNNIEEYHETVKSSAEILLHGIESITSTTNALSDFARTPVAQASVINIVDYVQYVVELFRNSNENINITFNSTSDSVLVMADRDLVISMFSNLINNAIQAIPNERKGDIVVNIYHNLSSVIISVVDNGIGISEENKDKIFNVNFTTKIHGMGLGLRLVKNVVDQAGGSVDFHSVEGEGSTFIVSFPIHKQ
jgi:nitrogen fixation/metabolism regulation signal transduction histidine kinase